jgi:hypothetical protein
VTGAGTSARSTLLWGGRITCALTVGLAVAGCGSSHPMIERQDLEQGVADAVEDAAGQRPDTVECPESLRADLGASTRCVLSAESERYGVTVIVVDEGGTFDVEVDEEPLP